MGKIELLDCTLRDGGHINQSRFGQDVIVSIIKHLLESNIDIIEVGFLQNCEHCLDVAIYNNIKEASYILPPKSRNVKYALMAQEDLYDIDKLEKNSGIIDIIRVSFHDFDMEEGLNFAKKVIEKGYQCFINPINLMGYSDEALLKLLDSINQINPYGFTIVDTFGSMLKEDLYRIYYLVHHNLNDKIAVAIHLHENMSLSYSLAQAFLEIIAPTRNACIDASLYGMGRVPGNLCVELIMDYMNRTMGKRYHIEFVYDAIDRYIIHWKSKVPWGYSIAYALSAQYQVHRTYAEYLLKKGKLQTKQINQILSMIDHKNRTKFNESYIESLYISFQDHAIDDKSDILEISEKIKNREVLIIAPGSSILKRKTKIMEFIKKKNPVIFLANFSWKEIEADFIFFSNFRRLHEFENSCSNTKRIITSNLLSECSKYDYVINYANYAYYKEKIFDNSVIMLLNMLNRIHQTIIYLAGFDGFSEEQNFVRESMNFNDTYRYNYDNQIIKEIISALSKKMNLCFITPSIYSDKNLMEIENE